MKKRETETETDRQIERTEKMRMSRQEGKGNEKEATTLGNPESDLTSA